MDNSDKIQKIKDNIAKMIKDSIENSEYWVTKYDVVQNSGVSSFTFYNILANRSDYTFESLVKVCLECGIKSINLE